MNDETKKLENLRELIKNEHKTLRGLIEQANMLSNILTENNFECLFAFKLKNDDFIYIDNLELSSCEGFITTLFSFFKNQIGKNDCKCESCKKTINRMTKLFVNLFLSLDESYNNIDNDINILRDTINNCKN